MAEDGTGGGVGGPDWTDSGGNKDRKQQGHCSGVFSFFHLILHSPAFVFLENPVKVEVGEGEHAMVCVGKTEIPIEFVSSAAT